MFGVPSSYDEIKDWRWSDFAPFAEKLLADDITPGNIDAWLTGYSKLTELATELATRAQVAVTQDTTNAEYAQRFTTFNNEVLPQLMHVGNQLDRKLVESGLVPDGMAIPIRNMKASLELYREANLPLISQDKNTSNEYTRVIGGQTVEWEGQEVTLNQLAPVMTETNRDRREKAWRSINERFLQDRDTLNDIWKRCLEIRDQIAKNADMPDYRAYQWKNRNRFDYSVDDALAFFDAIETAVVPVAERIANKRRKKLGLETLRPWDTAVDPQRREPLHPYHDIQELKDKTVDIFNRVDPELGEYLRIMRDEGYLDLENRKGKGPGGYMTFFPLSKRPFIFMNAVGLHQDVQTMLHESGHAFHGFSSAALRYVSQRSAPIEFAEVASMSMELLAAPYLTTEYGGFYTPADAARARIDKLSELPHLWTHIAAIASFQHWAYTHTEDARDPEKCDDEWERLLNRFTRRIDYSGLEKYKRNGWRHQSHIYMQPFYYIEYGFAQLGAVQVWANSLRDHRKALADYRKALKLGGTVTLPELYAAAGAKLAFDAETLHKAATLVEQTIEELEEVE